VTKAKALFVDPEGLTDEEVADRIIAFLDDAAPLPDEAEEPETPEAD
jgi:hypothetical protein